MPEIVDTSDDVQYEPVSLTPEPDQQELIEAKNRALIDEIHALGGHIPTALLQQVQIDMLVDLLWPQGSPTRKLYDLMLEDRLTGVLEQLKQATIRGRLTEGI
jgi:hypothetical protein